MIFLQTEHGSKQIDDWSEITSRPNFQPSINKGDHKLTEIFGYYRFKDEIHCGLSGCHQPHGLGFIVRTATGAETNVGHVCGEKEFGVAFKELASSFKEYYEVEQYKAIIISARTECDAWTQRINSLRSGKQNLDYCYSLLTDIQNANYAGRIAATEIRQLAKSQDGTVTLTEVATDAKSKAILFQLNRHMRDSGEATTEFEMGKVSFTHVLLAENNLRELYVALTVDIKKIAEIDINSPTPRLADASRISNTIEERIKKLKALHHDATKFLTPKNLAPVLKKIKYSSTTNDHDFRQFDYLLKSIK